MATDTAPATQPPTTEAPRYGEIFDRGYAHYDGPRRGRRGAITSLIGYSMKRAMGIRKSWTAKIMPFLLYLSASIPLIIMIGITAIVPDFPFASYTDYFSGIFMLVGLFVAIAAPEMICVDRHERTLPLYFSRAIFRGDYVLAKVVAMSLLTMTMTGLPGALLWLGRQLASDNIRQAMVDNIEDLGKILFLGILTSLMLGTLGLMISSFTTRKGVAITIILIGFLVLTGAAQALAITLEEYSWSRWFLLGDIQTVVSSLSIQLFDDATGPNRFVEQANLSFEGIIAYMLGLTLVAWIVLRWRYAPRDDA
jgi:ABC-2 type transport system permease protein